jgi:hypothetical protein
VKSNENIDTGTKGAVRAPAPSTQTKAEREAAAIKEYQSKPVTAGPKLKPLAGPPSPSTTRTAAPVSAPKAAAPTKVVAPAAAAPARVAAPAAAPVRAAAPAPAAVRPSTTTYTTSSAPSSSSSSSSSSFSSNSRSSSSSSSSGSKKIAQSGYFTGSTVNRSGSAITAVCSVACQRILDRAVDLAEPRQGRDRYGVSQAVVALAWPDHRHGEGARRRFFRSDLDGPLTGTGADRQHDTIGRARAGHAFAAVIDHCKLLGK